ATGDAPSCWSDIERQDAVAGANRYRVAGVLYCVAPLAELNGTSSIRLSELRFDGLLDWSNPE
ncbi:MAG: hypothetical protein ACREQZ_13255, partial [Woeseiaceae bacterium]